MKEYALRVVGIVLLSAVLLAIVPNGKTTSAVKGVTKTACLVVILSPVVGFFSSYFSSRKEVVATETFFGETVIEEDRAFIQYNCAMRIRFAEASLQAELKERYQIDVVADIDWEWQTDSAEYTEKIVKILSVTLRSEYEIEEETKRAVCAYIKEKYCSEVLIE